MSITDSRLCGVIGVALHCHFAVSFQMICRLFFHAIWRTVRRTKGADSNDCTGFVVGICTEDRFGSIPTTAASARRDRLLKAVAIEMLSRLIRRSKIPALMIIRANFN